MTNPTPKPAAFPPHYWIRSSKTGVTASPCNWYPDEEPEYLSFIEHQEILDRAVKEARAEALGEAVDLIKQEQADGALLCSTLDALDEMSDEARAEGGGE